MPSRRADPAHVFFAAAHQQQHRRRLRADRSDVPGGMRVRRVRRTQAHRHTGTQAHRHTRTPVAAAAAAAAAAWPQRRSLPQRARAGGGWRVARAKPRTARCGAGREAGILEERRRLGRRVMRGQTAERRVRRDHQNCEERHDDATVALAPRGGSWPNARVVGRHLGTRHAPVLSAGGHASVSSSGGSSSNGCAQRDGVLSERRQNAAVLASLQLVKKQS